MSIVCGLLARAGAGPVSASWRDALRGAISRRGAGSLCEYEAPGLYLLKLDLGALDDPGWHCGEGGAVAVSGDPLLAGRTPERSRAFDVSQLAAAEPRSLAGLLRTARGSFNAAVYRRDTHVLELATDKLGARPVYWMEQDGCVAFAGALRLLLALPGVRLCADLSGAIEALSFGAPLADRTEYAEIRSLRGGRVLAVSASAVAEQTYWRWDRDACGAVASDPEAQMDRLYTAFSEAVRLRRGSQRAAYCAVTGGLDSRCTATELERQGTRIVSLNVSRPGSLDESLGRRYAESLGTTHLERTLRDAESGRDLDWISAELIRSHAATRAADGPDPRRLWTGNGGSVGLGHVYLTPRSVAAFREQGLDAGLDRFLEDTGIRAGSRAFRPPWRERFAALPRAAARREIESSECADPARRLFVFLLENDQRRHDAPRFETLDEVGVELVEPFYDAEVLAAVCALPLDLCLGHRMYHAWLTRFPPLVREVPWQAYPGHDPCPLPLPRGDYAQWQTPPSRAAARRQRREAMEQSWHALTTAPGISRFVYRRALVLAYLAAALGSPRFDHGAHSAAAIARLLDACEGRFATG